MTESDEVLISRCWRGDERSFDILFERYRARIYTFVLRFVKDHKIAEDIFQETFIRVFRKARHFRHQAKFSTWLYTIAANLCRDELKRRKRRRCFSLDAPAADEKWEGQASSLIQAIPDASDGPRAQAQKRELSRVLTLALEELPRDARLVIELHVMQGLRYREVAEILQCPIGTVQSRMHNAVQLLRKKVERRLRKPI
ncbi:sigma-70 family RNA polymerase sigma factor [bacterium]|nr:sigma-70 family RNA polymerase sigma factor [bacterium]